MDIYLLRVFSYRIYCSFCILLCLSNLFWGSLDVKSLKKWIKFCLVLNFSCPSSNIPLCTQKAGIMVVRYPPFIFVSFLSSCTFFILTHGGLSSLLAYQHSNNYFYKVELHFSVLLSVKYSLTNGKWSNKDAPSCRTPQGRDADQLNRSNSNPEKWVGE